VIFFRLRIPYTEVLLSRYLPMQDLEVTTPQQLFGMEPHPLKKKETYLGIKP
jgi:hypothetical protein